VQLAWFLNPWREDELVAATWNQIVAFRSAKGRSFRGAKGDDLPHRHVFHADGRMSQHIYWRIWTQPGLSW
jgi:hypothetical protein